VSDGSTNTTRGDETMDANDKVKAERITELHRELDAAPNRKVGTPWWNDRIAELKRLLGN
jgi:hypothetical protein